MGRAVNNENAKRKNRGTCDARLGWSAAARRTGPGFCVALLLCAITPMVLGQDDPLVPSDLDEPATISGAGALPLDTLDVWSTFRPRFSLVHDAGGGIGYQNSFTSLEFFVPLAHPEPDQLWFADFRGLFNKHGATGGNLGVGRRFWHPGLDAAFGAHLYYDYRETVANQFQQLSPGFDILTDRWDFRANGYLPMVFDDRKPAPDRFGGNLLFIDRFETAMTGADMELGVPIPLFERFQPKVLGGLYCFDGPERGNFWGWRARVQGQLTDAVSLYLSVQDDPLFDTTVNFAVAVRFPGGALMRRRPLAALVDGLLSYPLRRRADERLAADVRRLQNIVVDDAEETLAINPATGQPIKFLHVAAGGNSDGSFGDPYATLTQALNDPRYQAGEVDGIYVRSGFQQSITHTGDVSLVEGTQLLSNGPVQTIATQLGRRVLPLSGVDPDLRQLPIIQGQVNLGDNTCITGFEIHSPANKSAVSGIAVNDFKIDRNVIRFPTTANGIFLQEIEGTGTITGNQLTGGGACSSSDAPYLWSWPAPLPPLGGNGIVITECPSFAGTIDSNSIQDTPGHALQVTDSTFLGDITNNTFTKSLAGILIQSLSFDELDESTWRETSFNGKITDNRILGNCSDGIVVTQSDVTAQIARNTIDKNQRIGIAIIRANFNGTIEDNTISGTFQGSLPTPAELSRIFKVDPNTQRLVEIDLSGVTPQSAITIHSAIAKVDILNNRISEHQRAGIEIELTTVPFYVPDEVYSGTIRGNTVHNSILGVSVIQNSAHTHGPINADIEENNLDANASGIVVALDGEDKFNGNIRKNETSRNEKYGIYIKAGHITGNVTDNIANDNKSDGIALFAYDDTYISQIGGNIVGNVSDNQIERNGNSGLDIWATTKIVGDIANNTANQNAQGISFGTS